MKHSPLCLLALLSSCALPDYVELQAGVGSWDGTALGPGFYELDGGNHWIAIVGGWDVGARLVRIEDKESIDAIERLGEQIEDLEDEVDHAQDAAHDPATASNPEGDGGQNDMLLITTGASAIIGVMLEILRRFGLLGGTLKNVLNKSDPEG